MPVFDGEPFVRRALESLRAQTLAEWELLIVDDGSTDGTPEAIEPYLADARVDVRRRERNLGLGAALNDGLDRAHGDLVAYLPADDVFYSQHLESLAALLDRGAVVAYSGIRHHYNRFAPGAIEGSWLQLVQVMHRRT